jgi:hypothetical protein
LQLSGAATEIKMRAAKDLAATVIRHYCEKKCGKYYDPSPAKSLMLF